MIATQPLDAESFNQLALRAKARAIAFLLALLDNPETPPEQARRAAVTLTRVKLVSKEEAPDHFAPIESGERFDRPPVAPLPPSQDPKDLSDLNPHDQRLIRNMAHRAREDPTWHPSPTFAPHLHARFASIYAALIRQSPPASAETQSRAPAQTASTHPPAAPARAP